MPPKDIDGYVAWVLGQDESLKLVDEDVKLQLCDDYSKALVGEVNAMIISRLGNEQLGQLEDLLDRSGSLASQEFIQKNIPDLEEAVAGVLVRFRNNYLGSYA